MNRKVPLVDLKRQYSRIKKEIDASMARVINDSAFILGSRVETFERKFAAYCGSKYCIGLNSGTDALGIIYRALGIGRGDEVITVANTFFATIEPFLLLGAKPVFVDIDPETHLMDPNLIEARITKRTKAIVPVHLYGQMADMKAILRIARKHRIPVIEDAAQAHGASQFGKRAGTFGAAGCFSFYPGKNLGAYGDAGCIVTNDARLAAFARKFRDHGRSGKYKHDVAGMSSRMDGLQASVLSAKLPHLNAWIARRREIARRYRELLPSHVMSLREARGNYHAYHLYVVEADKRDALLSHLKQRGVEAGIHYPIPLHKQKAYLRLPGAKRWRLPVTETKAKRILSLPIFPELSEREVRRVVSAVAEFYA